MGRGGTGRGSYLGDLEGEEVSDNPNADQYVDKAWEEPETESEAATGVSRNISLGSFPPAYRLGGTAPFEGVVQERQYGTPYRGGATVQHGVRQLFAPSPPDQPLEQVPSSEGPVIGGEPAEPAMPFPEPVPVQVVSMPQMNQIPMQRDGQVRLPPRNGAQGTPVVTNVVSREQNRDGMWFAAGNHTDEPGVPYCVHFTFQRDLGNFIFENPRTGTPQATWGVPLKSDGSWYGSVNHTEGVWGFNTMHFDPAEMEHYLTMPKYLNKAMWLIEGMDAETYLGNLTSYEMPDKMVQTMRMVKSEVPRMDFLAMVEAMTWRTLHFNLGYNTQVG